MSEATQAEGVFEQEDAPQGGGGDEEGVDAVEDAAVAREQGPGVFDADAALNGGFEQVAKLSGEIDDDRKQDGLPDGFEDVEHGVAAGGERIRRGR